MKIEIWQTIRVGTGLKTACDFHGAITLDGAIGNNMKSGAHEMLNHVPVSDERVQLDLASVSVKELGFHSKTTYDNICRQAFRNGLSLCPSEVGPQLFLQDTRMQKGEYVAIAMSPISYEAGFWDIFSVSRTNDGRPGHSHYLGSIECVRELSYDIDHRFVFVVARRPDPILNWEV